MLFKSLGYLAPRARAPLMVESQMMGKTRQRDMDEMRLLDFNVLPFPCSKNAVFPIYSRKHLQWRTEPLCLLHCSCAVRLQIVWGNQQWKSLLQYPADIPQFLS